MTATAAFWFGATVSGIVFFIVGIIFGTGIFIMCKGYTSDEVKYLRSIANAAEMYRVGKIWSVNSSQYWEQLDSALRRYKDFTGGINNGK